MLKKEFTIAKYALHGASGNVKRGAAFTLAEVLITLAIIGVVAAMTFPQLIKNYQGAVFRIDTGFAVDGLSRRADT